MTPLEQTIFDDNPARMPEGLGTSEAFLAFQERLSRAARVNRSVLLIGERGTGKELAASRLHYLSARWRRPLITLNCAALAPTLIAPELFGYEAGAFTGAEQRRVGRFEAAHQSTLFLDEIGNIPMEAQEKILRVIEYGTFERVGSTESITVDVRIIAATNANLPALAAEGHFKPDLLDRLSFEVLFLPPLRERQDDIQLLANHFAAQMAHELGRTDIPEFSDDAIDALESYPWPGNIRELKNAVERAVYRADSERVSDIVFDPFSDPFTPSRPAATAVVEAKPLAPDTAEEAPPTAQSLHDAVRDFEIKMMKQALEEARHHQRKAAERLGLTYHQFRGLYRKYREALE
ncbi:MAG: ATPase AAA [Candidatus Entotheonella factor]|uniref:ATPase AAA n=1 Tax=Entotheonella factor TaxID=1429438 RepID=W4LN94_ENTF1|nr:phage shock protein operon transcriptional activator [Candidatus Entotheonella palauensis]ETW99190.1 MAG: ATPase AAA [Candidatus Entotheonella factor]